jgi:hypothetical protein
MDTTSALKALTHPNLNAFTRLPKDVVRFLAVPVNPEKPVKPLEVLEAVLAVVVAE